MTSANRLAMIGLDAADLGLIRANLEALPNLARTLADVVAAGQAAGAMQPAPLGEMTLTAWSLVHGLALLLAGRRIPAPVIDDAFVERMAEQCVALLMRGLAR